MPWGLRMAPSHPAAGFRRLIATAILGMVLFGASIYFGVNYAVDRAVTLDAEEKAADWADYFIDTMPGIEMLVAAGELNPEQRAVISTAEKLGNVFRFKLFDRQGGLVLVSDEIEDAGIASEREHSEKAAGVLATGRSNVSLNDGTGKENRPPLYVEAYVPMFGPDARIAAVVEVYLDATGTAGRFREIFALLATGLSVLAALAFGLPTLAYILRSKQASEAKQRVEFLAHHDPMTNLLNRGRFTQVLERRMGEAEPGEVAVVLFDVDDFKAINDSAGHEAGDEYLRHVARSISASRAEADLVARLGGDEFTIALFGRDTGAIIDAVEAILRTCREPISVRGKSVAGRISAGIYVAEDPKTGMADAMHRADVALYQAKIDGGNGWRLFSEEVETSMRARRELEQMLRDAVARQAFDIHYQPLLHAQTKRCAGFEALLRLPDGAGGLVPPATFIPVAESIGLINEIGKWVIEQATQTAAKWPDGLFVAVNLSVKQFSDGKLIGQVRDALARSGLKPGQLELEVTESMLMENTEAVAAQLGALRAMGVSIAMDDFGTGYSSLGYLWKFGFDKLKIDRSFVTGLEVNDGHARDILDTIIMLGHKLNMTVTAEGIETEDQARVLSALACDHFQGYLYGRPVPAAAIPAFLASNLGQGRAGRRRERAAQTA
jgi:diguanylate cyclase (GGDEF)-like protein